MKEKIPPGMALVAMAHGKGYILCWQGDPTVTDYITDAGGTEGHMALSAIVGRNEEPKPDGIYIVEFDWELTGTSDYDGCPETDLEPKSWRLATKTEWKAHLDGEWPWEPYPVPTECEFCLGNGSRGDETCVPCDGTGMSSS